MAKIFLLVIINLLFYLPSLKFFFVSDDFYFLSVNSLIEALKFRPDFNHHIPVFWFVIWLIKSIFGLSPFIFHLVTLLVHVLNVILVYFLGLLLIKNKTLALLAAIIYSFFFSHYEVVYWVTGLSTSLMVFFYLVGLLFFTKFLENQKLINYLLFLLSFILAVFSHEYAFTLPFICIAYYLLITKNKKELFGIIKLFSLPLVILFLLFFFRISQSAVPLTAQSPDITRFIISITKSSLYLFIANPFFVDSLPKIFLVLLSLLTMIIIIIKSHRSNINLFLLIWCFLTILLFSSTSLPQARYFYLSSIPAILLIISLFNFSKLFKPIGMIYITFILLSGIIFLKYQQMQWNKASKITQNIVTKLNQDITNSNLKQPIYIVDLLDSVNGPPWQAYVFRNGLEDAIYMYTDRKAKINYLRTVGAGGRVRNDPLTTWDNIHLLIDKGETVYQFDNGPDTLSLLKKL
ncbi:hypothetical protein A2773_04685 [Candidatus Gottesmanbacteria bacterium RIFCSPHIGHO2_01_FULL_39_10]|uniref:Glycosyltransferase RgtA/B/C/D-like domain-containing protein n=1 Tax=Candidatus Gottesmanbacteria bacterium RIFCSPHIGHO2_01_FULL_39_10 TaxID=1798375 RepID=A0A1F5ZSS4_9BACT|nr:MAG: hypothetical protein A2773_04685 [Candidatus Gottesmanbacteria bacterium RIFCSPHIGHO2_01_FULL_39_10]